MFHQSLNNQFKPFVELGISALILPQWLVMVLPTHNSHCQLCDLSGSAVAVELWSSDRNKLLLAASLRQRPAEGLKVLEATDHLLPNCICEIEQKLKRGETG